MREVIAYQRPDIDVACDFAIRIGDGMNSAYVNEGTRDLVRNVLEGSFVPFYKNGVSVRLTYRPNNGNNDFMYVEIECSDISKEPKALDPKGNLISVQADDPWEVYHSIERIGNEMHLRKVRGQRDYAKAV